MDAEKTLIAEINREKIERARKAGIEEKLLDGPRLFKISCEAIKAGLRIDNPHADEDEIHERLLERIYGPR